MFNVLFYFHPDLLPLFRDFIIKIVNNFLL